MGDDVVTSVALTRSSNTELLRDRAAVGEVAS
jgi:hypothetical protein